MATEYHLTIKGPRPCRVDRSNPNSTGCPKGGMHFDSFDDAMAAYTEDLEEQFGAYHVLVRPSSVERGRRLGYRALEGVELIRANPQVQAALSDLNIVTKKAREAFQELRATRTIPVDGSRPQGLPESVEAEPLGSQQNQEQSEADENSRELFDSATEPVPTVDLPAESTPVESLHSRILANANRASFDLEPVDSSNLDEAIARIEHRESSRAVRAARSKRTVRPPVSPKVRMERAMSAGVAQGNRALAGAGYAVRSSASVAGELTAQRAKVAQARALRSTAALKAKASSAQAELKLRSERMSLPASHIRPGDTFDGTTVRAVESRDDGRIRVSYQVKPGGPMLSTTVPADRTMSVDRKTRRQARNARLASRVAKPVSQVKALSDRVKSLSADELLSFNKLKSYDDRSADIEKTIRQHNRSMQQQELIGKLRALRQSASDRVLQRS